MVVFLFLKAALAKVQIEFGPKLLDAFVDNAEVLFGKSGQAPVSLEHLDDMGEAANLIAGLGSAGPAHRQRLLNKIEPLTPGSQPAPQIEILGVEQFLVENSDLQQVLRGAP